LLDQLLNEGWAYHDTEGERLARELETAAERGVPSALLGRFIHLSTHTIGEHLSDWPRALALGRRILGDAVEGPEAAMVFQRLHVAAVMAQDAILAAKLEVAGLRAASDPLAAVLSMRVLLAEALAASGRTADAGEVYAGALEIAGRLEATPDLERRIAAVSNNIAWTLHDRPSRTPAETTLMQCAAAESLRAWRRGGDWVNEELALQLQASVALSVGDPTAALAHAMAGVRLIAAHGQRPFDAARLHLMRARAFAALGDAERQTQALDQADLAAAEIAVEGLRRQYQEERARSLSAPD
jgi:hypothetical protein